MSTMSTTTTTTTTINENQGEFRPKQSLGQNYLSDQNYVMKICNHFGDTSEGGRRVLELGPGAGALTQVREDGMWLLHRQQARVGV